jgi:hypothetical protein
VQRLLEGVPAQPEGGRERLSGLGCPVDGDENVKCSSGQLSPWQSFGTQEPLVSDGHIAVPNEDHFPDTSGAEGAVCLGTGWEKQVEGKPSRKHLVQPSAPFPLPLPPFCCLAGALSIILESEEEAPSRRIEHLVCDSQFLTHAASCFYVKKK